MSELDHLIERVGRLWDAGEDTCSIGEELKIPEHRAVLLVGKHREKSRLRRARPIASSLKAFA